MFLTHNSEVKSLNWDEGCELDIQYDRLEKSDFPSQEFNDIYTHRLCVHRKASSSCKNAA